MVLGLSVLLSLTGCTTEKEENLVVTGEFSDCDSLDEGLCAFPFPSTFFMKENSEKTSGWQIDYRPTSLPENIDGVQADPKFWNERDGFSPLTPIITFFPDLSLDGVIGHDNLDAYEASDAKTVIIDVETGERVPHFAELDMSHEQDDRRALVLRPVEPMEWGHRYVVGIRGLKKTDGSDVDVSDTFRALRDDSYTKDYDIEGRRALYDDIIFPALEGTGFSRTETQLAWDFVVASKEGVTEKAVAMRDDLLERLPTGGPSYVIDSVETFTIEENENVAKRIYGTMTVPYYTEEAKRGTVLSRDENGMPMYMGETEREFTVIVPRSLWDEGQSGAILQYGHGLMGEQSEVKGGYLGEIANRYGYVLIAVDWTGMSNDDFPAVMEMIVMEVDKFAMIPERCQQGFVEFIAAMKLISGDLAQDAELMTQDSEGNAVSVVNTEERYYYGNSQGGILGTPYMALSPDIERGVLGVSGGPYAILLPRSVDFDSYFLVFKTMYPDYMDITLWLGLMQTLWDSAEPSGYLDSINKDPLPGTAAKDVLIQVAIGDAQVSTLGAHIQARGIGAGLLPNPVRDVWGVDELTDGATGSGFVEWDYGLEEPFESIPPEKDTDPHGKVRKEFESQEQLHRFLKTGELVNFCDGVCQNLE